MRSTHAPAHLDRAVEVSLESLEIGVGLAKPPHSAAAVLTGIEAFVLLEGVIDQYGEAGMDGIQFGVLLISEDLDELLALSDRLFVIYEGELVGEVTAEEATAERKRQVAAAEADIAQAAKVTVNGMFRNSGQVCVAGSRLRRVSGDTSSASSSFSQSSSSEVEGFFFRALMALFLAMVSSQVEKRLRAGSNALSLAKAVRKTSWARSSP